METRGIVGNAKLLECEIGIEIPVANPIGLLTKVFNSFFVCPLDV
jgi:hypothetical protein